jgi:hypothetical protein
MVTAILKIKMRHFSRNLSLSEEITQIPNFFPGSYSGKNFGSILSGILWLQNLLGYPDSIGSDSEDKRCCALNISIVLCDSIKMLRFASPVYLTTRLMIQISKN